MDRRLLLSQLYAACGLILLGAIVGLIGQKYVDKSTGLALGTAVIGAGATLLPSHAAASSAIATTAMGTAVADGAAIAAGSAAPEPDASPQPTPADGADHADALAAEDPTLAGIDLGLTKNGDGDATATSTAATAGRQADGDL